MTTQFYHDMKRPEVEKAARAICLEHGLDPDQIIPDNGYLDAARIPRWYQQQEKALAVLAVLKSLDMVAS